MKKLISSLVIKQAHKDGKKEILAPMRTTIITPEARTVAKELGIKLVDSLTPDEQSAKSKDFTIDEKLVRVVTEKVIEKLPPEKRNVENVKNVVNQVITKYSKGNVDD